MNSQPEQTCLTPEDGVSRCAPVARLAHVAFAAAHVLAGVMRITHAPLAGLSAQDTRWEFALGGHMVAPCRAAPQPDAQSVQAPE
jgi:hypothetical protein